MDGAKISIKCACGFEATQLLWYDAYVPPEKLIEKKVMRLEIGSCESGGIYSVLVRCPNCDETIELASGYDIK